MAQTYQNSPFEDFAEVGLAVAVFVSLFGSFKPTIAACFRQIGESKVEYDSFFEKKSKTSGIMDGYVLFNKFPKLMTLLFIINPIIIVTIFTLTESVFFHTDPEKAVLGHYIGEGLFFLTVYFFALMSISFSFPLLQSMAAERGWERIFDKFPIQYQDRFYTACGFPSISAYNTFLLLTKINSTDFMEQDVVDRLLIADILLPWTVLIRTKVLIEGFYFFLPAFEFNEAHGGLITYLCLQYGFLGGVLAMFGSVNVPSLYILEVCYFLFLALPKISFLVYFKKVKVKSTTSEELQFSVPLRRALFDGADISIKKIPMEGLHKVGGIGLKNFVLVWNGDNYFPTPLPGYVVREETEDTFTSEIIVTRKTKGLEGIFAFTSLHVLYSLVLPLLLFFRPTDIKYYKSFNVLQEVKPGKEMTLRISRPMGRSIMATLAGFQNVLFVMDSPGIEPSYSFFLKYFTMSREHSHGKEAFFLWNCTTFMDVMLVVKFLKAIHHKYKWNGGDEEGIRYLIVCQLSPPKVWAVRDAIDGTGADFIREKMFNGVAKIEHLKSEGLFNNTDKAETAVVSLGSAGLTAPVKCLKSKVGDHFFDVIYDYTMTGRNAFEPNGFFHVS